jgi:hypothetical protein
MQEMLQEYVDSRGVSVRVDRAAGMIRGVKVLGLESRNGRSYLPEALAQAVPLYEGAKVNVNHPKGGPQAPRDYQDRIGAIRNVALRPGEGLFADLFFNPKHALAEQLIWDAEHAPENVGFSHNVEARTSRTGDRVVVEAILRVQGVDLVADPATTRGLFESIPCGTACSLPAALTPCPSPEAGEGSCLPGGELAVAHHQPTGPGESDQLTLEQLKSKRPDLVEAILEGAAADLARLRAEVERFRAAEALRQKHLRVRQLLKEFHLPDPDRAEGLPKALVSERFLQTLLEAPSEEAMRQILEERAALARSVAAFGPAEGLAKARPLSRDQLLLDGTAPLDAKSFVEAIT